MRVDVKMGRGKIAAQVAHGVIDCYKEAMKMRKEVVELWEQEGMAKIVVQINSEQELIKVVDNAKSNGVPGSIIADAGRTEVSPGTITVGAIGPGLKSEISKYTGHLKLLT